MNGEVANLKIDLFQKIITEINPVAQKRITITQEAYHQATETTIFLTIILKTMKGSLNLTLPHHVHYGMIKIMTRIIHLHERAARQAW